MAATCIWQFRAPGTRAAQDRHDPLQHRYLIGRCAVRSPTIVRERDRILDETETGERGANPEVVVLAALQRFVEAANRFVHTPTQDGHDANRVLVFEHVDQPNRPAIRGRLSSAVWPSKATAEVVRVPGDHIHARQMVEDLHLCREEGRMPDIIAVQQREVGAARLAHPDVPRRRGSLPIWARQHAQSFIAVGKTARQRERAVGRAIVDNQ